MASSPQRVEQKKVPPRTNVLLGLDLALVAHLDVLGDGLGRGGLLGAGTGLLGRRVGLSVVVVVGGLLDGRLALLGGCSRGQSVGIVWRGGVCSVFLGVGCFMC